MSTGGSGDDDDLGNVVELRPPPRGADPVDEGESAPADGFGKVVEFRQPAGPEPPRERRIHVTKGRRWKWAPSEDAVGFSVHADASGEYVVLAFENPGRRGVYEIWLPWHTVGERGFSMDQLRDASLSRRLYPVLNSARERRDQIRRSDGKRETECEALGVDGPWKLVRGTKPRDGGRPDEVWWEVTGGGRPMRIYGEGYEDERQARRDFDGHKPPFRCGAFRSGDDCKRGWYLAVDGHPCIRKANHPDQHRDKEGLEWSTWPRTGAVLALDRNQPTGTYQPPAAPAAESTACADAPSPVGERP